jgi:hypothetical protein
MIKQVRRRFKNNTDSDFDSAATTPGTPNGIVSLVPSSGKISVLHSFPETFFASESVFDTESKTYWMLVGENLVGFNMVNQTVLTQVALDTTQCSGGSACFSELRWDSVHQRIVAVGMGFAAPGGRIVGIDTVSGSVTSLSASFSKDCALYIECSSFDSLEQVFYPWLACADAPTASLYAFDLKSKSNTTILDNWDFHAVLGPSTFVQGVGIIAVDEHNCLVQVEIKMSNKTTVLSKSLGGIPSNNGLTAAKSVAYVSLVEYAKNKLAIINFTTSPASVKLEEIPFAVENPFTYQSH